MSEMTKVGESDFQAEVLGSDRLTLVEFGAEWCGPCKKLHPIMEDLAREYASAIKVVEMDVGESPKVAVDFRVTSVPQLLFFHGGVVKDTVIGLLPKSKIAAKIDHLLANSKT